MSCFIPDRRIVVGKTRKKALVTVCINCSSYGIPHFNYISKKYEVTFSLLSAEFVDSFENIGLEDRTDVEEFLNSIVSTKKIEKTNKQIKKLNKNFFKQQKKLIKTLGREKVATIDEGNKYFSVNIKDIKKGMTYWELVLKIWNDNNSQKVSKNIHKPYYRNFIEYIDTCTFSNKKQSEQYLDGAKLYIKTDQESRPNFHYVLKDGTDFTILFEKPEYLEPIPRKLTKDEIDKLINFLNMYEEYRGKNNVKTTNWEAGIWCWNDQNYSYNDFSPIWFPKYKELNENLKMPDYTKLNDKDYLLKKDL